MNYIQGVVKAIIYYNNENSYNIIKVKITDSNEDLNI